MRRVLYSTSSGVRPSVRRVGARTRAFLLCDEIGVDRAKIMFGAEVGGILARIGAIDEGAEHVIVRHAGHFSRRIKARHGRARMFVDPDTGRAMAGAEADLGYVHLDHALAIIRPALRVEAAAARPLVGVEDLSRSG